MNSKRNKELKEIKKIMQEQDVSFQIARKIVRTKNNYGTAIWFDGDKMMQKCSYRGYCQYPCNGGC